MGQFLTLTAGLGAVVFAGLMVVQRSLYNSAICLLVVLFQAALLFVVSGAPLLGFLQVMIYAGAVMVLIVVTIMAAPAPAGSERWARFFLPRPAAWAGLALLAVEVAAVALTAAQPLAPAASSPALSEAGPLLFGPWAVATEAATLLMLLASLSLVPARE